MCNFFETIFITKDVPEPGLSQEEALSNAPQQSQGQFRTPKVVESA